MKTTKTIEIDELEDCLLTAIAIAWPDGLTEERLDYVRRALELYNDPDIQRALKEQHTIRSVSE